MSLKLTNKEIELIRELLEERFWIVKNKGDESKMEEIMDIDSKLFDFIEGYEY